MKIFLPKSILARFLLILITPTILSQAIFSYLFFGRYVETVTNCISNMVIGEIIVLKNALDNNYKNVNAIANTMHINVDVIKNSRIKHVKTRYKNKVYKTLYKFLLKNDITSVFITSKRGQICLYIDAINNFVYKFTFYKKQIYGRVTAIIIMWSILSTIILLFIAFVFLKNQIRPIKKLANAMRDFGNGIDSNEYTPNGSTEIELAGEAFCTMKKNFRELLAKRINNLAGISHDLKTPLTRMKLQLALMPKNSETQGLSNDIDSMIKITESFLTYSNELHNESFSYFNLYNFLQNIIKNYAFCQMTKYDKKIVICAKKTLLLRAVNNIITNAKKYAENLYISFAQHSDIISILFEDDGKGIDPDVMCDIFSPFYTQNSNGKNNNNKNVGLGLSIVRDVVLDHGGTVDVANSTKYGGASFTINIPATK